MSTPLDVLARYGAARAAVSLEQGEESVDGPGGRLATQVDRLGTAPLTALLSDGTEVEALVLQDAEVELRLERAGREARLTVRWTGGTTHSELLPLDPEPAPAEGRPLFEPDPATRIADPAAALRDGSTPLYVVETGAGQAWFSGGRWSAGGPEALPLVASSAPDQPLGPAWFRDRIGLRANYLAGAMAGGISSPELVIALGRAGLLGFYGAGGLDLGTVGEAIATIQEALGDRPAGYNLLHNPLEPAVEEATVDLFLERGCRIVSASAYMGLTPAVVRYRYRGATRGPDGTWSCPNRVFAKVSRAEVALHFLRPAPQRIVDELVATGRLTREEGEAAVTLPMADALTCEADSGGHTDHRPFTVVLPLLRRLRDRIAAEHDHAGQGVRIALGAAGGIGTPEAVAAAHALGADYVLTGSINQCTLEAGTSATAKELLLDAGMADVADGPAPDMFELGAHVQVLSRGTLWAARSRRLYDLYKRYRSWGEVPEADRAKVEKQILRRPYDEVWADTRAWWQGRDPAQVARAEADPRHELALVFRWYLGMGSRWARLGDQDRKRDYQIWCGPAMGAFNDWVEGSPLEPLEARSVVAVADALLEAAGALTRRQELERAGVVVP